MRRRAHFAARFVTCLTVTVAAWAHAAGGGGSIAVTLSQADGTALAGAAVTVRRLGSVSAAAPAPTPADNAAGDGNWAMDQVNRAFDPEVIVVPVGAAVRFPNSDSVSHQVYSFSPTKRFQLPLYRGKPYPPVRFDTPGIVTLGCNIHDNMIGWILVTDAPWFGSSDAAGSWRANALPAGDYEVTIWHPRLRDDAKALSSHVHIEAGNTTRSSFRSAKPMRPAPLTGKSREWDY